MNQTPIVNPSLDQLKSLRRLVYGIRNTVNGKFYIGQTTLSFYERYNESPFWWKSMHNVHLERSVNLHGPDKFEVWIFAHSIERIEDINRIEDELAVKHEAYHPSGYNFRPCGNNHEKRYCKQYAIDQGEKQAKEYTFKILATGEIKTIKNLRRFCRENGLHSAPFRYSISRFGLTYKGYCHVTTTKADISNRKFYRLYKKYPPFSLWKNGEKFIFDDIREFSKAHGLNFCYVNQLLGGRIDCYLGFTRDKDTVQIFSRQKYYDIRLKDESGNIHLFKNGRDFHRLTGKNSQIVISLINGVATKMSGFTLVDYKIYEKATPVLNNSTKLNCRTRSPEPEPCS